MAADGVPVLSRIERGVLIAVVVAGVLVLAGGVWGVVNRDRITVWLTGDEVAAAQRLAMTAELPMGLEDDPTRSACEPWSALRCAWSDQAPEEAARLVVDVLEGGGLEAGDIVCDGLADVPDSVLAADAVCAARFAVAGEELWVVTTDRTPIGHVPLSRTAAWVVWDELPMSAPMMERLQGEWAWDLTEAYVAPSGQEVAEVLPDRFAPLIEGPCRSEAAGVCFDWEGPVDLSDLGPEPVEALVAELTDAGYFVDVAAVDWSEGVRAHRFLHAAAPGGLSVLVRMVDGAAVGQVFTY